ncbi:DUF6973 domain-containing protein [Nocardia sp. NPDC060259]|uniref:DUF6973 domain-containing protein n=1 Tax=Nocardia sp. NPDC060259 TaxID=3347088 RepID=UPI00364C979B
MVEQLTVPVVLKWDLRYLKQCVTIMRETATSIDTEASGAGQKNAQSEPFFAGQAGDVSRTRGADDKFDTIATSDVLENLADSLDLYVGELETNINTIREQKRQAESSTWDLYVTDDGHVKSRKSNWETMLENPLFGAAAVAAKEFWTTRYDNLISAALTWVQRVDQEGAELYIRNIEGLSDRTKQETVTTPTDPELARILRDNQVDSSGEPPRLWPVGFIADALEENGIQISPSLYTAEEIAAMERLYYTQGIGAVGQALSFPDQARQAAEEYSPTTEADGQGDAFRHMYWNALMSQKFGEEWTETYATAHEMTGGNNPHREAMDLWNNDLGRKIGAANPDASPEELQALVRQEVESGKGVVITAKDATGNQLPADQVQLSWSRSTDPGVTGPPAGVGIPLPGGK